MPRSLLIEANRSGAGPLDRLYVSFLSASGLELVIGNLLRDDPIFGDVTRVCAEWTKDANNQFTRRTKSTAAE